MMSALKEIKSSFLAYPTTPCCATQSQIFLVPRCKMREYAAIALHRFTYFAMLYCVVLTAFYAVYVPLALFSLYCILKKEIKTRAHWTLFAITVLTMIMTTIYTIAYLAHYLRAVSPRRRRQ
jgi:uncharacterized membrane protein (DUF485 family)